MATSTWFDSGDLVFSGTSHSELVRLVDDDTAQVDQVSWRPNTGITSPNGRYTYYFSLIDMLVPFTLYPKLQYAGTQLVTACHGDASSRVPPEYYCDRQEEKFRNICGMGLNA